MNKERDSDERSHGFAHAWPARNAGGFAGVPELRGRTDCTRARRAGGAGAGAMPPRTRTIGAPPPGAMSRPHFAVSPRRSPPPPLDVLLPMMEKDGNSWFATYRGIEIRSAFQPVMSVSHSRVIGYEALMRARTPKGDGLPPPLVFSLARRHEEAVLLDRLSRAVHVANFADQGGEIGWLFLNVLPQILEASSEDAEFADQLISISSCPPSASCSNCSSSRPPTNARSRRRSTPFTVATS